ncbi:hypothetical protein INT43_003430, partial [Umbelopsis isabellina]
ILEYFNKLGIPEEKAAVLRERYFVEYGLSIRGMIQHHDVDPVAFGKDRAFNTFSKIEHNELILLKRVIDKEVDGRLPLETILKPDPELTKMLTELKMRKWILTNAGLEHAKRVLKIMGIDDQFEGITYCNYSEPDFPCKPEVEMYKRALKEANVPENCKCYFVDDSAVNVQAATKLGWVSVHVADDPKVSSAGDFQIDSVTQLPQVLPELWQ